MTSDFPKPIRDPAQLFAPPEVIVERRSDGSLILRSPQVLGPYARALGEYLEHWADEAPDRAFVQERDVSGRWSGPSYSAARARVWRIATGLLRRGLSSDSPVMILSENSVDHALLTLAAMHVGIPVVPISTAYSLVSSDHARLRAIVDQVHPGLIYAADPDRYGPALTAIQGRYDGIVVSADAALTRDSIRFSELTTDLDSALVSRHFDAVVPETVAKLLFTSGSTGDPKGVVTTQRMLCSNQQAKTQLWPFLAAQPPLLVDWLPWSHTFGGNHNFNLILRHGGTIYVDAGRPVPSLFGETIRNLRDVAPTMYFNVPRGYDMLVTTLRTDDALRHHFFSRLQVIFYAAAALPQNLWESLHELSVETTGSPIPMCTAWGSTETAPSATDCHFQAAQSGVIGLPIPGTELKLVPSGVKLEVRVRGPNVMSGYWKRPDLTAQLFDDEGFYRIGDAVRFVDPAQPERGLFFDGRIAEDFKLDTGTWVNVGTLRITAVAALAPLAQDIVIAGHDRREIGFLIFPNVSACRALAASLPGDASVDAVLQHQSVRDAVQRRLQSLRDTGQGSSTYATRAVLLRDPPSIDRGEITDKGQINQRAVLEHRAMLVDALYSDQPSSSVIFP